MFRKVHYRLTLLCAGITTFILLTMSLIYLYVSESGLKESHFLAFQRDTGTLVTNFEQQTVITHTWLSQMENLNAFTISITDNGIPLLFTERAKEEKRQKSQAFMEKQAAALTERMHQAEQDQAQAREGGEEAPITDEELEAGFATIPSIPGIQ